MKKVVILGVNVSDILSLHVMPGFQEVWKYTPEIKSDPREYGRIVTEQVIFKFLAFSIQPERLNPETPKGDAIV